MASSLLFLPQGDEETVVSDMTRALIKGLPRLFIKYQTDENRISEVLLIPPLMNLDLYLEMRMMNVRRHPISVSVIEWNNDVL